MVGFEFRQVVTEESKLLADLIKKMVIEMENYGGYSVNRSPSIWESIESEIRENLTRPEFIYLVAIDSSINSKVVGMAAGYIEKLENIFNPQKRLHISAIYTVPQVRRQGVARNLLEFLLKWGQQLNAQEVELNVLVNNPARHLYEHFGFNDREISMTRKIQS